ncbi:MAG TPA: ATP-dependent DNA helicase RecG [Casimicrobiaceae bacterium]|nr:ATP-dependent DNA helicase RecG [Casimicrobiaceae bacterium]
MSAADPRASAKGAAPAPAPDARTTRAKASSAEEKSGATVAAKLARLGVARDIDRVLHVPLRYEDRTHLCPLSALEAGQSWQAEGTIANTEIQYRPRRQLVCLVEEGDARLVLRFFHFYPSQQKSLSPGRRVRVFGEVREGRFGPEMVHPAFSVVAPGTPLPDRLTPVYPTTAGLGQETLRRLIHRALEDPANLAETLPPWIRESRGLLPFRQAVTYLHHPPPDASQAALDDRSHEAWKRLKFDELLAQQLSLKMYRRARARRRAPRLAGDGSLTRTLRARLPFRLTRAQERVAAEIRRDLARAEPMQRLLQGDVGSGKTVIAALAALQAIESGYQAAFMAPTEVLAEQHYRKLAAWLAGLPVRMAWLSGSLPAKAKREAKTAMESGEAQFAIGTHALFQDEIALPRLGLAIVDEQHRFGVAQRLALRQKGIGDVHQLMMSATPIPRTLAMSFYADLDVSVIDEMPPGRKPVATRLVNQRRRGEVVERARRICAAGGQVYWVCPLIEESEKLELQTAVALHAELTSALPAITVGLLHGRMKPDEKAATMERFVRGEIGVLVATTVIEVGVDVPNAYLMVIEHAERFGLSQLHQLRGRVGRGVDEATCVLLFEEPMSEAAKARLKVIYGTNDGFEIARQDLLIRGPGEFLGARQSGVPLLRFADPEADVDLISSARAAAEEILRREPGVAKAHLERWLGGRADFIRV